MLKIVGLAIATASTLLARIPAFADGRSAAEFVLKTCLPVMDDFSKVDVMARENNWTLKSRRDDSRFRKSVSNWDVIEGDDRFFVSVWINHLGEQDYNICFVNFRNVDDNNKVNREEFLTVIAASGRLELIADTWFSKIQRRSERYEFRNDHIDGKRAKIVEFSIQSDPGINAHYLNMIGVMENFAPLGPPDAPSEVNR
jgi:hypothetical protein